VCSPFLSSPHLRGEKKLHFPIEAEKIPTLFPSGLLLRGVTRTDLKVLLNVLVASRTWSRKLYLSWHPTLFNPTLAKIKSLPCFSFRKAQDFQVVFAPEVADAV